MAHNLYRFYLYVVYVGMLIFAADGVRALLQLLFTFTPLRGEISLTHTDIVQGIVFGVVSLVIAAPLAGLHYWLIRRDMRSDPAAGSSAVRSFFLNFAEAIGLLTGVFNGAFVISALGQPYPQGYSPDLTGGTAYAIASLGFFAFVEWDRRRSQAAPGAAIVFQRIHRYGVQAILLISLTVYWFITVTQMLNSTASNTPGGAPLSQPNLLSLVASTLWVALFWVGYGLWARHDTYSRLRQVLHYISFAYGVGMVLSGVSLLLELALQPLFKVQVLPTYSPSALYSFVAPLTFGTVVVAVYSFWLSTSARPQIQRSTPFFIAEVIATVFLAISFWFGVGLLLYNVLEHIAPISALDPSNVVTSLAAIIPGIAYILLDLHLSRQGALVAAAAPRRALVFTLLGGGVLVSVGGLIALVYTLLTNLFGASFDGWQHIAHAAGAALIVSIIISGIYLWVARRERLFGARKPSPAVAATETPSVPVPAPLPTSEEPVVVPVTEAATTPLPDTTETAVTLESVPPSIEGILDELQAGKITRNEAATRIRELTR